MAMAPGMVTNCRISHFLFEATAMMLAQLSRRLPQAPTLLGCWKWDADATTLRDAEIDAVARLYVL